MKKFEDCFFVPPEAVTGDLLTIVGAEAKHIATVLRRRPGDVVTVVDGRGCRCKVELTSCTPSQVLGEIRERTQFARERPELWVAVGLVRTSRMDFLVEKCTELGVHAVLPLRTKRSLSSRGISDSRLARWRRIATAAMTQSAGTFLPSVLEPVSVEELVKTLGAGTTVFLADPLGKSMQRVDRGLLLVDRLVGCVGPEGGFTPEEMGLLVKAGAVPVTLGKRRLRTETAGIALADRLGLLLEGGTAEDVEGSSVTGAERSSAKPTTPGEPKLL